MALPIRLVVAALLGLPLAPAADAITEQRCLRKCAPQILRCQLDLGRACLASSNAEALEACADALLRSCQSDAVTGCLASKGRSCKIRKRCRQLKEAYCECTNLNEFLGTLGGDAEPLASLVGDEICGSVKRRCTRNACPPVVQTGCCKEIDTGDGTVSCFTTGCLTTDGTCLDGVVQACRSTPEVLRFWVPLPAGQPGQPTPACYTMATPGGGCVVAP